MDNSGFVSLNFSMNVANSQAQSTSQILQQLPGIQQLFTQNAPVKPSGAPQNVIQQAILPVNNPQQAGNQTVMASQTGLQFVGQPAPGFLGQQQQQQHLLAQHAAAQQMLGPRGVYTANYQLMPRNYTLVNQGVQGAGVAVQLSPQQIGTNIGTATLSPLEQQQQFLQSAGFDPQIAALHQNQQQIAFQNANGQLMIQSPTQQLMLQSPNQQFALQSPTQQFTIQNQNQFAVQSPSIAQFTPQQQLLSNGQGNNVLVQGQNGGMILQSENFMAQGLNQNVFMQNPSIVQNVNQQIYGNAQNILTNQIPGLLSQPQVITNQNMGILSVNQSPTGNGNLDNLTKANSQSNNSGITNQQMQLLAQIANHGGTELSQNLQNQQNMANSSNPNQSLPSFGHFLLHHHMQSLPHPFLQNLGINSVGSQQAVVTNAASDQNITRNLIGASSQTATLLANQCVPNLSSNDNSMQIKTVSDNNINAEFNNWNIEQFSNQSRVVNNVSSTGVQSLQTKQVKGVELKPGVQKLCSSKPSSTITTSNAISTGVVTTLSNVLSRATMPLKVCTNEGKGNITLQNAGVSDTFKQNVIQDLKPQSDLGSPNKLNGSEQNTIMVPYGWVRALEGDSIVYYSPTCTRLTSAESVRQYLVTDGTCKCGLDCPFHIEKVFNFSSEVISIKWTPSSIKDTGNLCNHKRKFSAVCQTSRSGLALRPDVSLVSSSAMMSPRVSSTVQENQGLYTSNKKQKMDNMNENNELKAENFTTDMEKKQKSASSLELSNQTVTGVNSNNVVVRKSDDRFKDNTAKQMISDNIVSTSLVESSALYIDTDECKPADVTTAENEKCSIKESIQACNTGDKGENEVVKTSINLLKTIPKLPLTQNSSGIKTDGLSPLRVENASVNSNISKNIEGKVSASEAVKNELVPSSVSSLHLTQQVVQSSSAGLKSPVHLKSNTEKKVSPSKSKSPVRSRSRSSASSRLPSDLSSPGSERNSSSRCSDRSLSPRNDHGFSAEMFTHFMNFCGVNPSDLPPVFQQNFIRVPSASPSGKSPTVQASVPQIHNTRKSDRLKLPVLPPNPLTPFQANVLANLHKLSSPPNQQVFPPFNLPGLPGNVHGGYQHGASVNSKGSSLTAANVRPFSHNQGPGFPFSSMFSTLGGTHPQMSNFVWLSPDGKSKNKKGRNKKVDCEKMEDLFDSNVPPPNVDVSQLKDKGHGPIPKQKIASFLENPTEFLKQQTELVNNSMSSTCSSPAVEGKRSENVEQADGEKTRSDSACSDRLNSPFRPEKEVFDKETAKVLKPAENVVESSKVSSENVEDNFVIASTRQDVTLSNECIVSKELTVIQSAPVASAPPTPTTVVHHTPGSLSCHQMSLIKARQHSLGLKDCKQDVPQGSLLNPIAAILNDPKIGQVFQQMFPEAVQEALMQSLDLPRTSIPAVGGQSQVLSHPATLGTSKTSSAPMIPNLITTPSTLPQTNTGMMPMAVQRPSFPIQELLSNLSQGEFPASSLLSAAAKAQIAQQNHLSMLMAHHLGPLSNNMLPLQNQTVSSALCHGTNTIQTSSVSAAESHMLPLPVSSVLGKTSVNNVTANANVPVNSTDKPKPKSGAPKISELLNRNDSNKQSGRHEVEMFNLIQQLQKQGTSSHIPIPEMVKMAHLGQALPPQPPVHNLANPSVTTENMNSSTLVAPVVSAMPGGQHTPLIDAQLLQMYNALGFPLQNVTPQKQQLSASDTQLHAPDMCVDTAASNTTLNQLMNSQPNSSSVSSLPLLLRQQDHGNSAVSNMQNFVPLLGNSNGPAQMLNLQGIHNPSNINEILQQHTSFGHSAPHNSGVHLQPSNQSVSIPNSVADASHNPLLIGNPMAMNSNAQAVMNMLNIQQSIGNGTNLTAMQLQTLQLQQQLLQQLQQVQGMQSLISQYNLQNIAVNNNATVERRQTNNVANANSDVVVTEPSRNDIADQSVAAAMPNVEVCVSSSVEANNVNTGPLPMVSGGTEEVTLRRSNTVRVIAAADTTEDCSSTTRTVDIGTETDAIDEDNSELQSEYEDDLDENTSNASPSDMESDPGEITLIKAVSSNTLPPATLPVSKTSNLNTCLAIATQKGTTRSSELESRLLGEKSSLARSQNLAAELTKPSGNELKLKIKRKRLLECSVERAVEAAKKMKSKERREEQIYFEKKELRSSTLAATKASSSLAAVISKGKDASRMKEMQVEAKSDIKQVPCDGDPKPSCSNEDIVAKEIQKKTQVSNEYLECDSSVDSDNSSQTLDITNNTTECVKKDNLTSRIAAALSSQKGQWQLSCLKKNLAQICEGPKETQTSSEGDTEFNVTEIGQQQGEHVTSKEEEEGSYEGHQEQQSLLSRVFSTGDLVWGQIRGFPSWPGKLVDNTESKCGDTIEGKVFVKWFGDNTVTQVEPNKLKTLSEGLEAHHKARKKHRRGRKMNSNLEQAIQQAMAELDKKTASTAVQCKNELDKKATSTAVQCKHELDKKTSAAVMCKQELDKKTASTAVQCKQDLDKKTSAAAVQCKQMNKSDKIMKQVKVKQKK
ncbi:uncharacterized protein LOC123561679 [Mercenaria mercenaria]|uniref:uncharacterized protein LOC123561679 n=1 Tax=Mercenaria mercenaria TaxID=6596 RepID=UPI00234E9F14|nr:uncharacterized protein LOC123561679 [Mercenaria mercenaria]